MGTLRAADVLRQTHFLRDLDEKEILALAGSLAREEYDRGAVIVHQGATADALYILQQGEAEAVRQEREGPPHRIAILAPGDTIGEMELVIRQPRHATIRALSPSVVLRWERRSLVAFLQEHASALASLRFAALSRQRALRLRLRWLEEGEVVHALARRHPLLLYRALLLPALLLAGAAGLGAWSLTGGGSLVGWVAAGLALVGLAFGAWQWVDWGNDYYIVTDRRAVWLEKVVGLYDSRQEAPLRMVLSVSTSTEVIGRLLDYGDVLIRTFTGTLAFRAVSQPRAMAALIEEHWRRTQERAEEVDHEDIVEALHERLGPSTEESAQPPSSEPAPGRERSPRDIGLDRWTLQVRFEEKGVITYRKHWAVLARATFAPACLILLIVGLLGARLGGLIQVLPLTSALLAAGSVLLPLVLWWLYQYADWANDIYQVTPDQIVDIHKKPLASEVRKVAPLENILGTEVDRKGLVGLVLNYGDVIANVGTTQFAFQGVYDPSGVQQDIARALEAFLERKKRGERDRRRQEMVEWLGAYHQETATRRPDGRSQDKK